MKAVILLLNTNSKEVTNSQGWALCNPIHFFHALAHLNFRSSLEDVVTIISDDEGASNLDIEGAHTFQIA